MSAPGWIIAKAADRRPTPEVLAEFFDRLERVISSRLGAGQPIGVAFVSERWARELEGDLLDRPATARAVVDRLARRLRPVSSIAEFRGALGELRSNLDAIASAIDASNEVVPPHVLYRLFSSSGVLLYVGITDRGPARWVEHARTKTWFGAVARFEIERFETRELVEAAEREAIIAERPLYNVVHNAASLAG